MRATITAMVVLVMVFATGAGAASSVVIEGQGAGMQRWVLNKDPFVGGCRGAIRTDDGVSVQFRSTLAKNCDIDLMARLRVVGSLSSLSCSDHSCDSFITVVADSIDVLAATSDKGKNEVSVVGWPTLALRDGRGWCVLTISDGESLVINTSFDDDTACGYAYQPERIRVVGKLTKNGIDGTSLKISP